MDTREFNRRMKYAHLNDDPYGVLNAIYENELPHPYFDPANIGFSKLRDFDHNSWLVRENTSRTMVLENLEYWLPGEKFIWDLPDSPTYHPQDIIINSCKTVNDHLITCTNVFSSWHLSKVFENNKDTYVEQHSYRSYFADILLGNAKPMRQCFFDNLAKNNLLAENLVNMFGQYKSDYIDQGTGEIDIFFRSIDTSGSYTNTTLQFKEQFASQFVSKHIQESSWYSVVAETLDDNRIFFPTEKVGKAMISGKPFFVLSGKHFLRNLREIGFKTFSPVIDESYDDIDDPIERAEAVFESFFQVLQLDPAQVRNRLLLVLEHNERVMRNKHLLTKNARNILQNLQTHV